MIKVNVISGFLGSGKTTLIKHLASALIENNEKVVILENEFGTVGIDGKMLEHEGLSVYEISSGCICCTLKGDFTDTLVRIADDIKPDRILVEPSGIFVLSEIEDIFRNPEIRGRLSLHSTLTVIDYLKFLKQRSKYSYFFENQINCADMLVLNKIKDMPEAVLFDIIEELQRINPRGFIVSGEWDSMEREDFLKLLEPQIKRVRLKKTKPEAAARTNTIRADKKIRPKHGHGNHNFTAFGLVPQTAYSQSALEEILARFVDGGFGTVLRAKGFVPCGNGLLQFNYVDGTYEIIQAAPDIEPAVCFIGEDLDSGGITEIFSGTE